VVATGESGSPELVADHGDGMPAGFDIVIRSEDTPTLRLDAKEREVVAGDDDARREVGDAVRIQARRDAAPRGHAVEQGAAVAPGGIRGVREDGTRGAARDVH